MPSWPTVLDEIKKWNPDTVRRNYLHKLFEYTNRNVIAYYSGFMSKPGMQLLEITDEDMNGFMQTVHQLDRSLGLDLILHTPGGSIASTEAIVNYLHNIFGENMRAMIPQAALSAGTMVACSCYEIVMGKQSSLGTIDPHLRGIPAQGVLDEFKKALDEYKSDPASIMVWKEILAKYQPTFLGQCSNAVLWTKAFVEDQLTNNMFRGEPDAAQKAAAIVARLSDSNETRSHERHLPASACAAMGLKIRMLEEDQKLQDLLLTVHHCYMHVLSNSGAFKMIENHIGVAFIKATIQQFVPMIAPQPPPQKTPKGN
jgi:hypothetical protein